MAEERSNIKKKRYAIAFFIAWMLFIGVDFLFHASIFASLWKENIAGIKSLDNLAILIPAGYGSFLLFTVLIGYVYIRIFPVKPTLKKAFKFAIIFGALFSLSNLLGQFSYVAIPLKHLLFFNFVYFIEIVIVTLSLQFTLFTSKLKKVVWVSFLMFFILIITGVVLQNVL